MFDDKRSIFHAMLGFLTAFLLQFSLIVILAYVFYQVRERENPVATVGDVVEFLIGYVYGLVFLVWLALGFYI